MVSSAAPAVTVREATASDYDRLAVLVGHFIDATAYAARVEADPADREALLRRMLAGEVGHIVVLERDGVVEGFIGVIVFPNQLTGRMTGSELIWWVEPHARGAGRLLLDAAVAWAKHEGAREFHVVAWNEGLEVFYRRLGYTKLETVYVRSLED